MAVIKASEFRGQSKTELEGKLVELKEELAKLRIQNVSSSGVKSNRIHDVRKSIAVILTIINLTQREKVREFYKDKKFIPKDLRPKLTRAIRRRLSVRDAARKTVKLQKRERHFPQKKFALKV